jgi:hypothetical protein
VIHANNSNPPPLAAIAAALRKTTELLAYEVAVPSSEGPVWTDFEWRVAKAAAAMQGLSSLLWSTQTWRSPELWRRFLREQRDHCVGRYTRTAHILGTVDSEARRKGVHLVALKGAALYAMGVYSAGERPMADIDLLVREADSAVTAQILVSCGYRYVLSSARHQVFAEQTVKGAANGRLGEHVDDPIKIELHTRITEHLPVAEIDITKFIFPSNPNAGVNAYPSSASLMMHLLLHAAGNMRARALRNIQLHDIALLAARFKQSDWEELLAARPGGRQLWWALSPMMLAAHYYRTVIPARIINRLGIECPRRLAKIATRQVLTDVSWSNIRIQAFPGIEWCQTPSEALHFMWRRIWPSRKARSELRGAAADIPREFTVPWYGISHGFYLGRLGCRLCSPFAQR